MRWRLLAGVLLVGVAVGVAGAADGPLADAGLDQSVIQGATVYLDAGGSTAPDGEITEHEWTIERPNGTETAPACPSCARTQFVAEQPGTYAVTVKVTDDQGRTDRDTLYVEVTAREMPEATLSGPTTLTVGEPGTFTLEGTAGDASLASYSLFTNDNQRGSEEWESNVEQGFSFAESGEYTVVGTVTDTAGYRDRVEQTVIVNPAESNGEDPAETRGSTGDGLGLGTTYDRLFVGEDGELYVATGSKIGEDNEFSMYLPNGEELKISTERLSYSPGPMTDDAVSMIDDSAVGFEAGVAQLGTASQIGEYSEYSIDELKQMMPETDCQLSGHDAERCVEQDLTLLTEEGQEEHGQMFTDRGPSWEEKEYDGHPNLGPDETRVSNREENSQDTAKSDSRGDSVSTPHPGKHSVDSNEDTNGVSQEGEHTADSVSELVPPGAERHAETGTQAGEKTDSSDIGDESESSEDGSKINTGGNVGTSQELIKL